MGLEFYHRYHYNHVMSQRKWSCSLWAVDRKYKQKTPSDPVLIRTQARDKRTRDVNGLSQQNCRDRMWKEQLLQVDCIPSRRKMQVLHSLYLIMCKYQISSNWSKKYVLAFSMNISFIWGWTFCLLSIFFFLNKIRFNYLFLPPE